MEISLDNIGEELRKKRKAIKISQEEMAYRVNIGTSHLSHIETGKAIPSIKLAINLMNELGLSPNQLFYKRSNDSENIEEEEYDIFEGCSTELIAKLSEQFKVIRKLNEESQREKR